MIDEECKDGIKPKYRIYTNGLECDDIYQDIEYAFQKFVDEYHYNFHYCALQLNTEIPQTVEDYLSKKHSDLLFWCMKSHFVGKTLADWKTTYDLIILVFNRKGIEDDISFCGEIHPFFCGIKHEWIHGQVNDIESSRTCYNELFRRAALYRNRFLYMYSEIFNSLSVLKYENSENKGSFVFIENNQDNTPILLNKIYNIKIKFIEPICFKESQYKHIRKLMEISNNDYSLLVNDKDEIFAIGNIKSGIKCKYYKVTFDGNLHWTVYIGDKKYIEYINMIPRLPDKNIGITEEDIQKYKDTFKTDNIGAFKYIVDKATKQAHGTMVVFAENAKEEAERLSASGMLITPVNLCESDIVSAISSIDGAIVCDVSGECYAIGTILDGKSSKWADSSYGARHNSAIRYLEQQKEKNYKTLIVVVSEDGYVRCFSTNDKNLF